MRVEEIAIRQEARQMLNEAGINQNTLKDMVKEILEEKLDRAIDQALHEKDVDGTIGNRIDHCIQSKADDIVRNEIRRKVGSIFDRMTVCVDIKDKDGQYVTKVR